MSKLLIFLLLGLLGMMGEISASSYIGCYVDKSARDLKKCTYSSAKMTQESCINYCKKQGYKYAALQYHSQCFCDSSYGSYGRAKESDCYAPCKGNKVQVCGGAWRNSVFAISDPSLPSPGWFAPGNGYQYLLLRNPCSWSQAHQTCRTLGGTLAYLGIKNLNVRFYIGRVMFPDDYPRIWVGLSDTNHEGRWRWLDNSYSSSSSGWFPKEPNDIGGNEDCAELGYSSSQHQYSLNDIPCSWKRPGLCEKVL